MTEVESKIKAARDVIHALCKPRGTAGHREWSMSIPAMPDYDPDLVIAGALNACETEIEQLRCEMAETLEFMQNRMSWEAFWEDGWLGREAASAAYGNYKAIAEFLTRSNKGVAFYKEHLALKKELRAIRAKDEGEVA